MTTSRPSHRMPLPLNMSLSWCLRSRAAPPARHVAHYTLCVVACRSSSEVDPGYCAKRRRSQVADSVYRVTEVIGVSADSWEAAARNAVETAAKSVRDLRVAEVLRQNVTIQDGALLSYRVRLGISFKYDSGD